MNATYDDENRAFADRLELALAGAGIPAVRGRLQRLADAAGGSHTAARKWLHGEQIPDNEKIVILAKWLRVNASWLQSGQGSMKESNLDDDEWAIVRAYRSADLRGKRTIKMIADAQMAA